MSDRKKPARWRKARKPLGGNLMDEHIWRRQHGEEVELWRGPIHLATVRPDGSWRTGIYDAHSMVGEEVLTFSSRLASGQADTVDAAKVEAKAAVLAEELRLFVLVLEGDS